MHMLGGRGQKQNAQRGGFPERRILDVPSVTPRTMREVQRIAQEDFAFDILQITENAGRAAAAVALAMTGGHGRGQRVVILAGGGNMGAAGLAAARHLVNWGCHVEPVFAEVETEMSFGARRQVQILRKAGIIEAVGESTSEDTMEQHLHDADLVIDAINGYGFEGPATGISAALINLLLESRRPTLALDVPTGLKATTGEPTEPCIEATTTLALDLPKVGVVAPAARPYVGELYLADLGIPRAVYERAGVIVGSTFADGPIIRIRR
ncbi:MAG: NAD(P)H-hydrate epimerase [Dehalococcoidia bacterium]|nr:NAD(P)H-hydrate epimerase [Dehalococcoidia bacterium]